MIEIKPIAAAATGVLCRCCWLRHAILFPGDCPGAAHGGAAQALFARGRAGGFAIAAGHATMRRIGFDQGE